MSRTEHMNPGCVRAAGLAGGGALSVLLTAATGSRWPLLLAIGLLIGTVIAYAQAVGHRRQRGKFWPSWVVGAVVALLLAWAYPDSRFLLLPWAGVEAGVAVAMYVWWRVHLDGAHDWLVIDDQDAVLRRELTRSAALRWAHAYTHDPRNPWENLTITRADDAPAVADHPPRYPHQ